MGVRTEPGSLPNDLALPDRYELGRRIASGGMASVWSAHDAVLGRQVAIKVLSEQLAHDHRAVPRFEREARAAARLSGHPHVVTIFDVGQSEEASGGRPFIVMEYHAGGTVADALLVCSVAPEEALRWLRQAAAALDYAHGRGVVHRDIKPRNFLLDRERALHVADFGIARIASEDTITGSGELLGTAAYLSPEQALGRPATEASDRYAFAVAAFELLVGERPFKAEHFAAQARQHVDEEPPRASRRNRRLPGEVDAVLARGMAKRAQERWPTAGAFVDALEASLRKGREQASLRKGPEEASTRRLIGGRSAAHPAARRKAPAPLPPPLGAASEDSRARRGSRAIALAALAAVLVGIGAAALLSGGGGGSHARVLRRAARPPTAAPPRRAHQPTKPPVASSLRGVPAEVRASTSTADSLEARGHQLMLSGEYLAAVPVLRQAVAAASPESLGYAYALYDLGRSLRLAGEPRAAIPILTARLRIPNQTDVVRHELELALRAVGASVAASGGATPASVGPAGHGQSGRGGNGGH